MVTKGFICNKCRTQFFSAAVEFIKDCPGCKSSDVSQLVPEGPKVKWKCSHCSTELFSTVYFAGAICINCKIGRMGVDPPPDMIDDFLKVLDKDLSAFEEAMGLEQGDLAIDNNVLDLEPIMENCISCVNDCDGCHHETVLQDMLQQGAVSKKGLDEAVKNTTEGILKKNKEEMLNRMSGMEKKIDNTLHPWNKNYPSQLKVNRGPKEYCRWCTHWTRKAECYGYCRKHDVVRNAFQHCIGFFRNQWAKDKITRWA